MAFNITDITSAINLRGGLAKPSHFFIQITPPAQLVSSSYAREAMFFCDSINLPGLNYQSAEVKPFGYGISENRPYDTTFSPVDGTFMVDADGKVIDFFHRWISLIHNFSPDTQGIMQGSKLSYGEWAYPEEYEGIVEIHHFDPVGRRIIRYILNRAFPITIGNISVGWEQNDSYMRLPISFAYSGWISESIPPTAVDNEEYYRSISNMYASKRPDIGLMYSYGLHLLQNGRRSPLAALGAVTTFANILL